MAKNGILVDYQYCTGCYSCEVACQSELDLPLGQWGVKVMQNGPWPIKDKEGNEIDMRSTCMISFQRSRSCAICAPSARRRASCLPASSTARQNAWSTALSTSL